MSSDVLGYLAIALFVLVLAALLWGLLFLAARQGLRAAPPPRDARYLDVELTYRTLRQQLEIGSLTESDLRSRLKDAMFQDAGGVWWMIGHETGEWYAFDGEEWAARVPAGRTSSSVPLVAAVKVAGRYAGTVFWRALMAVSAVLLSVLIGVSLMFLIPGFSVIWLLAGLAAGALLARWTIRRAARGTPKTVNKGAAT